MICKTTTDSVTDVEAETGLMLKLKLQYFGHLVRRADSFEKIDAGKD